MVSTTKLPSRLHHTAYVTRDLEATRKFYEELIGLPLVAIDSDPARMALPGQTGS